MIYCNVLICKDTSNTQLWMKSRNVYVWWHWHLLRHMGTGHLVSLLLLAAFWVWPPGCRQHFNVFPLSFIFTSLFESEMGISSLSSSLSWPLEWHIWPQELLTTSATFFSWPRQEECPPLANHFSFLFRALYLTKEDPFPLISPSIPCLPAPSLSPLHHRPSEPRVQPERGLCDLQLCLLSTQTSVRTAGRVREGQTVERHECT